VEQSDLLKYAAMQLRRLDVPYAVVGSFASSVWGESRLTQDIDIVVDLKPAHVGPICAAFPEPDFYVSATAAREAVARSTQFNVIHPSSGNKIDFMVSGQKAWVPAQLERCKQVRIFPDTDVNIAAPEDVILGKLLYYREGGSEKHLRDIAGILRLSRTLTDRDYIARQAEKLGVADLWESIENSFERR
jgi:hypothetical protein